MKHLACIKQYVFG